MENQIPEKNSWLKPENKKFIKETLNVLLMINKPEIPDYIKKYSEKNNLQVKKEFHASVIATKNGKKITDTFIDLDKRLEIENKIESLINKSEWNYKLLDEYYLMNKFYTLNDLEQSGYKDMPEQNRSSLIQKIELPDIEPFYKELSQITGINFGKVIPHITLYSGSDYEPMINRGIGIYSDEDFNKYKVEKIKE